MPDALRELERESLREFVASCAFGGPVLDYGCGAAPYRAIVEGQGARWYGYDLPSMPAHVAGLAHEDPGRVWGNPLLAARYTTILCTQVIQYVPNPFALLTMFQQVLARAPDAAGQLVLTGPTNWPVVEKEDLWRYTPAGIRHLLESVGFEVARLEERAHIASPGGPMLLGWGAVAYPKTIGGPCSRTS